MRKVLDVRGCSLVDGRGTIKGIIEDCIFDCKNKRICSFVVSARGIFTTPYLLSLKGVESYGDVVISDEKLYKIRRTTVKKHQAAMCQRLIDREVINSTGEVIGSLIDLIFEESTGLVKAIICSRGLFEDIIGGRKIVIVDDKTIFGKEKIIIGNDNIEIVNDISLKKFLG